MVAHIRRSLISVVVITAVFGFVYMFIGVGISQLLFHHQANGSITANGSPLIGQDWAATKCPGHPDGSCVFHGRPDNTGPYAAVVCASNAKNCTPSSGGDNPLVANGVSGSSGATNLGPRSQTLLTNTEQLVAYWKGLGVDNPTPDLVTTSGSGLDPDITPQDAMVQIAMVSDATGIPASQLQALINKETHSAQWGFLGAPYVNLLELNTALANLG
ncbi:MAG: potassium-transporting ATPase subunit C [Acidimicrobiales bacterium]|nr:potassium-transporting ATPase subunit C [Acidimicrobiales bacterium]